MNVVITKVHPMDAFSSLGSQIIGKEFKVLETEECWIDKDWTSGYFESIKEMTVNETDLPVGFVFAFFAIKYKEV